METIKIEIAVDALADRHGSWCSKNDRNDALRSLGLDLTTSLGKRLRQRFIDRVYANAAACGQLRSIRESERISPYLTSARDLLGDADEQQIVNMAASMADEAAEEAENERLAKEAEDAAIVDYLAKKEAVAAQVEAIRKALGKHLIAGACDGVKITGMVESAGGSWYGTYHGLKIRVSDHAHKPGGGFNQNTGERNGEPDVSFVVTSMAGVMTDRRDIRDPVLAAWDGTI